MADTIPAVSSSWLALAVETVRGTPVTPPTIWLPVDAPDYALMQDMLEDKGLRGDAVDIYDVVPGVRHDEEGAKCLIYLDTFPNLMRAILGSTDTKTGSGPYTHILNLLNSAPTTGNQPPSYTIYDWTGADYRQMAAGQIVSVDVDFVADGLMTADTKWIANPATVLTTPALTPAFSTVEAAPSWSGTVSIAGTSTVDLESATLSFSRGTKPVPTVGQQAPRRNWAGPLSTSFKCTLIWETEAQMTAYAAGTSQSFDFLFSPPSAASQSLEFHYSSAKYTSGSLNRGKDYLSQDFEGRAIPNSTDAASGSGTGLSPLAFTVINQQSTSY